VQVERIIGKLPDQIALRFTHSLQSLSEPCSMPGTFQTRVMTMSLLELIF
jgi:hypothetical protein